MPDAVVSTSPTGDHHIVPDGYVDCQIASHLECDGSHCEIRKTLVDLSRDQQALTLYAGKTAFVLSTLVGIIGVSLYCWLVVNNRSIPVYPWWILAIITAPYGGLALIQSQTLKR